MKLREFKVMVVKLLHQHGLPQTDVVGLPPIQNLEFHEKRIAEKGRSYVSVCERLNEMLVSVLGQATGSQTLGNTMS